MNKALFVFLLIVVTLIACSSNSKNSTALEAADAFMKGMLEADSEKINKLNHSDSFRYPTNRIIEIANEQDLVGLSPSDMNLKSYDDKTVLVSFPNSDHSPFALIFNKEKEGYFFNSMEEYSYFKDPVNEEATSEVTNEDDDSRCDLEYNDDLITSIPGKKRHLHFVDTYIDDEVSYEKYTVLQVENETGTYTSDCTGVIFENDERLIRYHSSFNDVTSIPDLFKNRISKFEGLNGMSLFLKKPYNKDSKWTEAESEEEGYEYISEIESTNSKVKTSYKTFSNAVEIKTYHVNSSENIKNLSMIIYYVKGIGIVKMKGFNEEPSDSSELTFETDLTSIKKVN